MRTATLDLVRRGLLAAWQGSEKDEACTKPSLDLDLSTEICLADLCLHEARAALEGDSAAAERLRLLLGSGDTPEALPDGTERSGEGSPTFQSGPQYLDGDALILLIAGAVHAANHPDEAVAMLDALGQLLDPLLRLEHAGKAAEEALRGNPHPMRLLALSGSLPGLPGGPLPVPGGLGLPLPMPGGDALPPLPGLPTGPKRPPKHYDYDEIPWNKNPLLNVPINWPWWWNCGKLAAIATAEAQKTSPRYEILSISDPEACAGQLITLTGRNFGDSGSVLFPRPPQAGPGLPQAQVVRWTDTEIDVVVPDWARPGEISLLTLARVVEVCFSKIPVNRLGTGIAFFGGIAEVYDIAIDGSQPACIRPGSTVTVGWLASIGPHVQVNVQLTVDGGVVWGRNGLPGGNQTVAMRVPNTPAPTQAEIVVSARNRCGGGPVKRLPVLIAVPPTLNIEYVEVTQGVQEDLAGVLAGRAMPTVANKDTAVRVHLRADRGGWNDDRLDRITGWLEVGGVMAQLRPTNARPGRGDRGFCEIRGTSDPAQTGSTLNFLIPAAWCTAGRHGITVHVVCEDPCGTIHLSKTVQWTWLDKAPLRLRWLTLNDSFGTQGGAAEAYARRVLDYLPTAVTDVAPAWHTNHTHSYDLKTIEGWEDLLDELEDLKNCTVWEDIAPWEDACSDADDGAKWLAVVSPSTPVAVRQGIADHPDDASPADVAIAVRYEPAIGAHELGHTLGLRHVCLAKTGTLPDLCEILDNGGFHRRPPFDPRKGQVVSTYTTRRSDGVLETKSDRPADLMSYWPPLWPTTTNWLRLFNTNFQ